MSLEITIDRNSKTAAVVFTTYFDMTNALRTETPEHWDVYTDKDVFVMAFSTEEEAEAKAATVKDSTVDHVVEPERLVMTQEDICKEAHRICGERWSKEYTTCGQDNTAEKVAAARDEALAKVAAEYAEKLTHISGLRITL